MKRVGGITAIGVLLLVAAWLAVFQLGRGFQPTSLLVLRALTAVMTSGTLLWLAKSAFLLEKGWVLHLAAVLQFVLAGVGVMFLPALALSVWNNSVDFPAYEFGVVWLLPTIAALVFCVTRSVGPTRG
jgi:hypothetical protein